MSAIPADNKPTEQVTPAKYLPLEKNVFKDHMNNIKSCIVENRNLKKDCKELQNSYTAVQADLLKLSNEISNLRSSLLRLDTLEKTNNTLQVKVDQQKSLIDEQKEMIYKSNNENNKAIEELEKQVLDLQKKNSKESLANEKEYKLICEAEEKRKNAESVRMKNEQLRNANEKSRSANDKSRKTNEELMKKLKKALEDKILESTQVNSYLQKEESNREKAEKIRVKDEINRTKKESERSNAMISSNELISNKIAEIELKINDMFENDCKQTCESSIIDKTNKPNSNKETKDKLEITGEALSFTNNIQLSLPEELNSALPSVKQESEVPKTKEATDTPIVIKTTEDVNTLHSDNQTIQTPTATNTKDGEIKETTSDNVDNSQKSNLIIKNTQLTTGEEKTEGELAAVEALISFEQRDKESEKFMRKISKRQKESTSEKVSLEEEKNIEQNKSILTPDAVIALSFPELTKLDIEDIVNPNVPDVFDEPEVLKHNAIKASKNTKMGIDVTLSTQKPREKIEEPSINPESPALKTNNDTFSGATSETLIGDGLLKEVQNAEGSKINESDEVIVEIKSESDKGRPI